MQKSTLMRAIKVMLVVGCILNLINNYDLFLGEEITATRLFKMALTFIVPFCVSAYSSHKALKDQKS